MGYLRTFFAATLVVLGYTLQNVTVVYWLAAPISPWGVLAFANLWFPLFFGTLLLGYACLKRDLSALLVADEPRERSLFRWGSLGQLCCWVGLANILNGYGIIYASPPDRTPPLIQAVLQNSGLVFGVPFSIVLLGDRKKYLTPAPLLCSLLVAASIAVSVLPTVLQGQAGEGFSGGKTVAWVAIYLAGIVPGALYNCIQQLYLIRSGALQPGVSAEHVTRATLRMLFWCNLWQMFWLVALWPLDILPFFGTSTGPGDWWSNTVFSLTCSYAGKAGAVGQDASRCQSLFGTSPSLWAFLFVTGYSVSYLGSSVLNRESATFNMLVAVITSAATALIFLLPGLNPNAESTPLWSVLTSLGLSLTAMVLWKRWESRTPAEEQFAQAAAAPGEGKGGFSALLSDDYGGDADDGSGYALGAGYGYDDGDSGYYLGTGAANGQGGVGVRLGWN